MSHPTPATWTPEERAVVDRYLAGDCAEHEAERARALLRQSPGIGVAIDVIRGEELAVAEQDLQRLWGRVARVVSGATVAGRRGTQDVRWVGTLRRSDGAKRRTNDPWPLAHRRLPGWIPATVGLAALVIGYATLSHRIFRHTDAPATAMASYATGNGERANITLTDGTKVVLDVASRLDVPADYPAGNRSVTLTGAAFFSVVHHGGTPFTVRTRDVNTRVLGTSFMVRRYATDTTTTIAVREGRVAARSFVIGSGQQIQISATRIGALQPASSGQFGFLTGVLTLKQVPFPQAIEELDRWYNVDIRLGDASLRTKLVDGQFGLGSPAELSEILKLTYQVRIVRVGRTLTLYAE